MKRKDIQNAMNYYMNVKKVEYAVCKRYVELYVSRFSLLYIQVLVKNHGREYHALYDPEYDMEVAQQMETETLSQFLNRVIFDVGQVDKESAKLRVVDEDGEYIITGGF